MTRGGWHACGALGQGGRRPSRRRRRHAVRELAPAKINLTLTVLGRRADGYHELESLVTFADVHDVVTLEPGAASQRRPWRGPSPAISAARTCSSGHSRCCGMRTRRLAPGLGPPRQEPAGCGRPRRRLGRRGSAAARRRAWPIRSAQPTSPGSTSPRELGADVPVCLGARPALMWGIGEKTDAAAGVCRKRTPCSSIPRLPLSTARRVQGARRADRHRQPQPAPAAPDLARSDRPASTTMRARGNDLERPGDPPAARHRRDQGRVWKPQPGCHLAAMSGSGPTCFGIFADRPQADRAAGGIAGAPRRLVGQSGDVAGKSGRLNRLQLARLMQKPMTSARARVGAWSGKIASASRAMAP